MTETLQNPAPNIPEVTGEATSFAQQVEQMGTEFMAKVPTPEEYDQLKELAAQMSGTHKTEYTGPDGEMIDKGAAEQLRTVSEESHWLLDEKQANDLTKVQKAERMSDLPQGLREEARKHKVDAMEPDNLLLARVKDEASRRLALDQAIRAEKKADAQAHETQLHEERSKLLSTRLRKEIDDTRSVTYDEVLKAKMAEVEKQLAEEAKKNPDKLNLHYLREDLTTKARNAAQEAANEAATTRQKFIEDNGGPAAIEHIKRQEAEAAKKEEFLKRLHGSGSEKDKEAAAQKAPIYAKLIRPEGVPYKVWLELTPDERKRAVGADLAAKGEDTTGDEELDEELKRLGLLGEGKHDPDDVGESVTDASPEGLAQRVKSIFNRATKRLATIRNSAVMTLTGVKVEKDSEDEKSTSLRRKVVGAFAGAAVVGVTTYLAYRGVSVTHHGGEAQQVISNINVNPRGENLLAAANAHSAHVAEHGHELLTQVMTLHKGETIWGDVASQLQHGGYEHSDATIERVTQAVLNHQHISWETARHLPVGYRWSIPQEVLDTLQKAKS